jgi:hypothetical protein
MSATASIVSQHRLASSFDFSLPPHQLDGIDVGCVARQWLDGQPPPLANEELLQRASSAQHSPQTEFIVLYTPGLTNTPSTVESAVGNLWRLSTASPHELRGTPTRTRP